MFVNWGYITNFYKRINIRDVYDIAQILDILPF